MNCYDFIKALRTGSYGNDLASFKEFLDAALQKFPKFCTTSLLHHVIESERIFAVSYVLTKFDKKTNWLDIGCARDTLNVDILDVICKHAPLKELNRALVDMAFFSPEYIEVLLNNGADPNTDGGRALLAAAEECALDTLKLLHSRGGRIFPALFDAACYWGSCETAYWLYLRGVRGYETPDFIAYKARQDAIRDAAQRKIYFWILPKLYRNKEFVMRQASKSYNDLFGVRECVSA